MSDAETLNRQCAAIGIERVHYDQFGERYEVAPETIRAIAAAVGIDKTTRPPMLEAATVFFAGADAADVVVSIPSDCEEGSLAWELAEEGGARRAGRARIAELELLERIDGLALERRRLSLPRGLRAGYHRFVASLGAARAETLLIVAPRRAYLPAPLADGKGIWGIAVQLYSLRSAQDWGIGDFGCLEALVRAAAAAGAGAVGMNPLHALMLDEPERASPYSPSSRRFLNPLYIAIEGVPEFAECPEAAALVRSPEFADRLQDLRARRLVDYAGVAALKRRVLAQLHASFRRASPGARGRDFADFLEAEGEPLRRFCTFQALRESRGAADTAQRDWRNWPKPYADPDSPAVAAFAERHAERIEFHAYCQWVARRQLAGCAAAAVIAGMPIGLYGDVAVGVDAAAGEAWAMQDVVVAGWSVGAPPDAWNRRGQDWGLSPLNPVALRRRAYRPFIDTIRENMRDTGALRIDHILGLWRSFWIPRGGAPRDGAYVRNDFAELVAIVALESHRARCVVVGEDLGTVPSGLREALESAGILSYRLLYFEHGPDGRRARASDYPRLSLVAAGTHDLPPLAAYWSGADIDARRALGIFHSDEEADAERGRRARDRDEIAGIWREAGLGAIADTAEAAYRFLARTPGRIVMVQIEDALGLVEQVNVPGTPDEPPNWRRRLPLPVETLFEHERVRTLAAALREERPSPF